MDVTVVIASYGERHWLDLGSQRAAASAFAQGVPVIYVHGLTLHDARNAGLAQVQTEHVIFLDADDELAPGYAVAMSAGSADIRVPSIQFIGANGRPRRPRILKVAGHQHDCTAACLSDGNFICIGAMVRTELARAAGGWRDFPWSEDWDLWVRCWKAGATVETVATALYVAHVRPGSRNRAPDREFKVAAHDAIHRANFPELYQEAA